MKKTNGKIQSGLLTGIILSVAIGAGVVAFLLFDASGTKSTLPPEYTYDIEQYAKIDPALIIYEQVGEAIETDFQEARAVVLDDAGSMYIAGDSKVVQYDPAGKPQNEIKLPKEPKMAFYSFKESIWKQLSTGFHHHHSPGIKGTGMQPTIDAK